MKIKDCIKAFFCYLMACLVILVIVLPVLLVWFLFKILVTPFEYIKFKHQYAEFLRELYESGIPVTYGSDSHHGYKDARATVEKYLAAAGFKEGDITDLPEEALWS